MITFKDFFLISEFSDLSDLDDLNLVSVPNYDNRKKYKYNFEIDGNKYEVYFNAVSMDITIFNSPEKSWANSERYDLFSDTDGAYDIGLTRNGDYNQSKTGNAFFVYTKIFAAFKKFMETAHPIALRFYGYDRAMDLVYQKFYKKFLSNDFMQIDKEIYIKKSHFEQMPPDKKEVIKKYMSDSMGSFENQLKTTRDDKQKIRQRQIQAAQASQDHDENPVLFASPLPPPEKEEEPHNPVDDFNDGERRRQQLLATRLAAARIVNRARTDAAADRSTQPARPARPAQNYFPNWADTLEDL